jgi:peptide deformylase
VSLLDVYVLGAPILRQETKVVTEITDDVRRLIDDMYETMYAAKGIGLAAPQVGRAERIAVVDVDGASFALINPEIIHREGKAVAEEGCLSIPEIYGEVERPAKVIIRATDRDGKLYEVEAGDLLGRCFQHEIDHLHGKLFIDYLSLLKRRAALSKWETLKNNYPSLIRRLTLQEVAKVKSDEDL